MRRAINLLLLITSLNTMGQNLVPNYSFEDYKTCPKDVNISTQIETIKNWFQPTYGTCDYFHQCSNPSVVGVPNNWNSFQIAHSGGAYMGFILYNKYNESREYIAVQLLSLLDSGYTYCVEFYVSLANNSEFATDAIGAYLSADSFAVANKLHLPYVPQIQNTKGNIITDTANWTLISGEYIAIGGEKYISIGNFYGDDSTNAINVGGPSYYAYYYIDDVSVVLCDTPYCAGVIQPQIYTVSDTVLLNSATVQFYDSSTYSSSWQWDFGDGTSASSVQNPVHTYDSIGVYPVRLIAAYGNCVDTVWDTVVVVNDVGREELAIGNWQLAIYPNPNDGEFVLTVGSWQSAVGSNKSKGQSQKYKVKIFDMLGKEIYQSEIKKSKIALRQNSVQVNLKSKIPPGIYFVQVLGEGRVLGRSKLVVIR